MGKQIRKQISVCDTCQRTKHPNRKYEGVTEAIVPTAPRQLYAIDLYGPLPASKFGNKYLVVILDVFSKAVQIYPIRKANARSCVVQTLKFFQKFGKPQRILSDLGSQFNSDEWKNRMEGEGVQISYTTVRNPQANPSERIMKEISRLFRVYIPDAHNKWFEVVPVLNYVLNNIPHGSTQWTPAQVHFNRSEEDPFKGVKLPSEISGIIRIDGNYQIVYDNLRKAANRRKKAQKQFLERKYEIGEKVLIRVPQTSSLDKKLFYKFFPIYKGPFEIKRVLDKNAVVLVDQNDTEIGIFNYRNIKPYRQENEL